MNALRDRLNRPRTRRGSARRVGLYIDEENITLAVINAGGSMVEHAVTRPANHPHSAQTLGAMVSDLGVRGLPAYVTLNRADYETQFVDLPGVSDQELRSALIFQATPPDGIEAEDCVATGTRLVNDHTAPSAGESMVRATIMGRERLESISHAVSEAGLNLQAVYPRETVLVTLAKQCVEDDQVDAPDHHGHAPPIMTVFVGSDTAGITIACGDDLYISRSLNMRRESPESSLTDRQYQQLLRECTRTASNFTTRLSDTAIEHTLIGPDFPGVEQVRSAMAEQIDASPEMIELPDHLHCAASDAAAVAGTASGLLAVAATLNTRRSPTASIYEPAPPQPAYASPRFLALATVGGYAVLGALTAYSMWNVHQKEQTLETIKAERSDKQNAVMELQNAIEKKQSAKASDDLVARRNELRDEEAAYQAIIEDFNGIATRFVPSLSDPLRSVAAATNEAVWIRDISVDAQSVKMSGMTVATFHPEQFIDALGRQNAFRGWGPDTLDIREPEPIGGGYTAYQFSFTGDAIPAVKAAEARFKKPGEGETNDGEESAE